MDLTKNRNLYFFLGFVFLINFLCKLINIDSSALWYDEMISAKDTLLDFGHIKHEAEWDKNPPFYHYVLWVWEKIFGISEFSLRSMSAFFSSLTAILIYIIASKISTRFFAIIATIIFSFHPYLFYYAQEARCYSLLIFLVALNLLTLFSVIQKPTFIKALLLGILNFLIFYTHYIAGLVLFFQFIFLLSVLRKNWLYLIIIYLTPILLVLLRFTKKQYQVLFFSGQMSREKSNVPIANLDLLRDSIPPLFISWITFTILISGIIFFVYKFKKSGPALDTLAKFKFFIVLLPVFCVLMLFGLGKLTNVFNERYLIFIIPYIVLSFIVFADNKYLMIAVVTIVLFFSVIQIEFGAPREMDYDFCAAITKEIEKKEKVVVLIQTYDVVPCFLYYYDINKFKAKEYDNREKLVEDGIYYMENVDELKNLNLPYDKRPILFFQTFVRKEDNSKIKEFFIEKGYRGIEKSGISGVQFTYLLKN